MARFPLTHWGRVTYICVSKLTIIGSDNGLSPDQHQAIIWTNAGILLIGTIGTNFSESLIEIRIFSFKKMGLKVSSAKWRLFCLGFNELPYRWRVPLRWHMELYQFCYFVKPRVVKMPTLSLLVASEVPVTTKLASWQLAVSVLVVKSPCWHHNNGR